jgi:hypothetical protein
MSGLAGEYWGEAVCDGRFHAARHRMPVGRHRGADCGAELNIHLSKSFRAEVFGICPVVHFTVKTKPIWLCDNSLKIQRSGLVHFYP